MRKILLVLLVLPCFSFAQTYVDSIPFSNGIIEFVKIIEVPDESAESLYTKTKLLIAEAYNSGRAVTDAAIPNSNIVVKGTASYPLKDFLGTIDQQMEHTLKMDFKDEKVRFTLSNLIVHNVNAECLIKPCDGLKYPKKVREKHASGIFNTCNDLISFFEQELQQTESDW